MNRLATTLLSFVVVVLPMNAAQRDTSALARIKSIYIVSAPDGQPIPQRESLARELTKVGFEIVGTPSAGDATLTVFARAEIIVDGDGSIPNKSIFTYELALPNKTVVWKYRSKFVSRTPSKDDDYAAQKMAAKLLKDKADSMRKAAHK